MENRILTGSDCRTTFEFGGLEPLNVVAYTEKMKHWRSILSVLIALWLPLQGYTAVAMPFCQHSMAAASSHVGTADHSRHRHDGHSGLIAKTDAPGNTAGISPANCISNDNIGGLGCNNCGVCHLACSPAITAVAPVHVPIGDAVLESVPADAQHFFYPEQPQHPPRFALL